jgi:hypothetical protein
MTAENISTTLLIIPRNHKRPDPGRFVLYPTLLASLASEMQQQHAVFPPVIPEGLTSDAWYTYQPYVSQRWPPLSDRAIRKRRIQLDAQRAQEQYTTEQRKLQLDFKKPQPAYAAKGIQSRKAPRIPETARQEPFSAQCSPAQEDAYTSGNYASLTHASIGSSPVFDFHTYGSEPSRTSSRSRGTPPSHCLSPGVVDLEIDIGPITYVIREPRDDAEMALLDNFVAEKKAREEENRDWGIEQKPQTVRLNWASEPKVEGDMLPLYTSPRPGTPRYQASEDVSAREVSQSVGQTINVALDMLRTVQDAVYALRDELIDREVVWLKEQR